MGRGRRRLAARGEPARERRARGHGVGAGSRRCGRGRARRLDVHGLRGRRHRQRRGDHDPEPLPAGCRPRRRRGQRRPHGRPAHRSGGTAPDQHAPRCRRVRHRQAVRPRRRPLQRGARPGRGGDGPARRAGRLHRGGGRPLPGGEVRADPVRPRRRQRRWLLRPRAGRHPPQRPGDARRHRRRPGPCRDRRARPDLPRGLSALELRDGLRARSAEQDHGGLRGDHDALPGVPRRTGAAGRGRRRRRGGQGARRRLPLPAGGPGGRARRRQPGADGDVGHRLRGDVAARRRAGGVRRRRRASDGRARAGHGAGARADPRVRPTVRVRRVQPRGPRRLPAPDRQEGLPAEVEVARNAAYEALAGCRPVPGHRPRHRADHRPQRVLPDRPPRGPRLPHRRDDAGRLGAVPRAPTWARPSRLPTARWPSPRRPPRCSRRDPAGSRSRAGSPRARPPPRPPTC